MNTRDYKQTGVGEIYHIYNRGNFKNNIFINREDYQFFLLRLRQNLFPETYEKNRYYRIQPLPSGSFTLLAYCLMPNHFHLLIKQNNEIPPSKLILKLCTSYSKYSNKKYKHVGHVFQDRFRQIIVDDNDYLTWLAAYIHLNPKVAGLIKNSAEYIWSSYPAYLNSQSDLCDTALIGNQFKNIQDFKEFTESSYEIIKSKKDMEDLLLDKGDF